MQIVGAQSSGLEVSMLEFQMPLFLKYERPLITGGWGEGTPQTFQTSVKQFPVLQSLLLRKTSKFSYSA